MEFRISKDLDRRRYRNELQYLKNIYDYYRYYFEKIANFAVAILYDVASIS